MGMQELGIILVIVLVLFGGSQLPKLARNLGRAQKEFKDGIEAGQADAAGSSATTRDSLGAAKPGTVDPVTEGTTSTDQ